MNSQNGNVPSVQKKDKSHSNKGIKLLYEPAFYINKTLKDYISNKLNDLETGGKISMLNNIKKIQFPKKINKFKNNSKERNNNLERINTLSNLINNSRKKFELKSNYPNKINPNNITNTKLNISHNIKNRTKFSQNDSKIKLNYSTKKIKKINPGSISTALSNNEDITNQFNNDKTNNMSNNSTIEMKASKHQSTTKKNKFKNKFFTNQIESKFLNLNDYSQSNNTKSEYNNNKVNRIFNQKMLTQKKDVQRIKSDNNTNKNNIGNYYENKVADILEHKDRNEEYIKKIEMLECENKFLKDEINDSRNRILVLENKIGEILNEKPPVWKEYSSPPQPMPYVKKYSDQNYPNNKRYILKNSDTKMLDKNVNFNTPKSMKLFNNNHLINKKYPTLQNSYNFAKKDKNLKLNSNKSISCLRTRNNEINLKVNLSNKSCNNIINKGRVITSKKRNQFKF